jgi:hypothetical protein
MNCVTVLGVSGIAFTNALTLHNIIDYVVVMSCDRLCVAFSARSITRLLGKLNIKEWIGQNCIVDVELVRTVREWIASGRNLWITPATPHSTHPT